MLPAVLVVRPLYVTFRCFLPGTAVLYHKYSYFLLYEEYSQEFLFLVTSPVRLTQDRGSPSLEANEKQNHSSRPKQPFLQQKAKQSSLAAPRLTSYPQPPPSPRARPPSLPRPPTPPPTPPGLPFSPFPPPRSPSAVNRFTNPLIGWSVGRSAGWSVGESIDRSIGWSVGRSVCRPVCRPTDPSIDQIDPPIRGMVN